MNDPNNDKKYSLSLSEDEWQMIINLVWSQHDFELAEELKDKLKNKYPEINIW